MGEFALGQRAQLIADGRTGLAGGEEVADLLKREARPLGGIDDREQSQHLGGVAALTADALRMGKQADRLEDALRPACWATWPMLRRTWSGEGPVRSLLWLMP